MCSRSASPPPTRTATSPRSMSCTRRFPAANGEAPMAARTSVSVLRPSTRARTAQSSRSTTGACATSGTRVSTLSDSGRASRRSCHSWARSRPAATSASTSRRTPMSAGSCDPTHTANSPEVQSSISPTASRAVLGGHLLGGLTVHDARLHERPHRILGLQRVRQIVGRHGHGCDHGAQESRASAVRGGRRDPSVHEVDGAHGSPGTSPACARCVRPSRAGTTPRRG